MSRRLPALLALGLLPALAFAQYKPWYNFYNFAYGAKARSLGNAFTAVADDLSASFWNPAGLALQRRPQFYLGYKSIVQHHAYDLQDNGAGGEETRLYNFNLDGRLNQIDFFSVSAPASALGRPWTFALGYYRYIPYGFKGTAREVLTFIRQRNDPRSSTVTFAGSEGLDVLAFSAATAVNAHFHVGATLQQFFGSGGMEKTRVERVGEEPTGQFHTQLSEKAQGRNLVLGALFAPFPWLRLGFAWHSGLKTSLASSLVSWSVDPEGGKVVEPERSCEARLAIPEGAALGVLLRPAPWLDLSADYSRINWDSGTIDGYYDAPGTLPYPQLDSWPQAQQPARNLRLGLEARFPLFSWQVSLRGGLSLERELYADAGGEAVRVTGYSSGLGCQLNPNLQLEAAYQRQVADWPEASFFNQGPDVATHFRANVFYVALTYRFGHIFRE